MKKFSVTLAIVMAFFIVACVAEAPIDMGVSVPLPPPIVISGPPEMVALPDTDVYVVPDCDQDIYFYGGWWWRPWGGRWYRSLNYDSGWEFYNGVPGWYGGVYPHWRENFRNHMWGGERWDYRPVPYHDVRTNWKSWQSSGYWRNQQNRGTTGSYHQGVETRRDFRGLGQETRYPQAPVATRQAPPETKGRQAPVVAHQAPAQTKSQQAPVTARQSPVVTQGLKASAPTQPRVDLSKNRKAFAGTYRGSDARIQSNRGFQSRQSMPSKGTGGVSKGNVGRPR